ncbi:hypothetical protein EVAR_100895_1 [Eumeta japonica]|uniref:Uncharacterized protein n=1 Tax=Eumeta variegata TaxID=151549 RepID=A0A4C1ZZ06_EUMVA|nr:hypothetical protein EVAR_100895_1 [Eumeta japonica]
MLSMVLPTHRKNSYSEVTVKEIRSAGLRGGTEIVVTAIIEVLPVYFAEPITAGEERLSSGDLELDDPAGRHPAGWNVD